MMRSLAAERFESLNALGWELILSSLAKISLCSACYYRNSLVIRSSTLMQCSDLVTTNLYKSLIESVFELIYELRMLGWKLIALKLASSWLSCDMTT